MAVWKEIRCDAIPVSDDCKSAKNHGPQGFESVTELHAEARRSGWLIKGGEAICPACRKLDKP